MLRRLGRTGIGLLAGMLGLYAAPTAARGDEARTGTIRDGFESAAPVWKQEQFDATINLQAHDRSRRAAHEGRLSEHFQFEAGPGSALFYSYALPKIPVSNDLRVGLFVRSGRSGVRVYGRVILPADTDPDTGQPTFVLVPGTTYENVDRWQRIELSEMLPSIEAQARVLRASTRRPVLLQGAYLERVVVNLYCGAGETEVFLDELSVGPVPAGAVASHLRRALEREGQAEAPAPGDATGPSPSPRPGARVALAQNRLKRNGYDWVFTAIEAPGADVAELRKAGFDVLVDDIHADPDRFRTATGHGFLLQPNLSADGEPLEAAEALAAVAAFPYRGAVALWGLGDQLGRSDDAEVRKTELERVRAIVSGFRGLPDDFSHLTTGVVHDDLALFARAPRNLGVVGIRPSCLASAQKPLDTYNFLAQRRTLAYLGNPGGLFCAWLPARMPDELRRGVWGDDAPPSWGFPAVQPEQLRIYTYLALAAGYRAIGFRGDADLTRNDNGRMLLIEMALLNEEIDLFESILGRGQDPIPLFYTYPTDPPKLPQPGNINVNQKIPKIKEYDPNPFTRVAMIDTIDRKGSLLVVNDLYDWAGIQPNQLAMNDLKVKIPTRESAQGWLVSPGGVKLLESDRDPGGRRFNIPDYGPTALILVTTDPALPERIRAMVEQVRPQAVQLAIWQAELQLKWVSEINGRLLADGHRLYDPTDPKAPKLPPGFPPPNDEALLLAKCQDYITAAHEAQERAAANPEEYLVAWSEARRASRPLRILMSAHWNKAYGDMVKAAAPYPEDKPERRLNVDHREKTKKPKKPPRPIVLPVACPPCLAFNLLPQHYIWVDWMRKSFGRNLVPSGTFDEFPTLESLEEEGWVDVSRPMDQVTATVGTVKSTRDGRHRILKLKVAATNKDMIDKLPPQLDFPIAAIRSPEIPVKAGQFLRISVDISKSRYDPPGQGGVIIRDSIGGEPLQFRYNDVVIDLTPVVLYRRAPADGLVTVTLGLATYGEAYFNDFKVELAEGAGTDSDSAGAPGPPLPAPSAPIPPAADPATARRPPARPPINR